MTTALLPVIGKPAPDFTLPSTTGENISLRQYKGKRTVVLFFYPKDETPGCTREACDFRDNLARDLTSHRLETFNIPMQAAGYRTAFLGKWHMGNDPTPRPGWDYWVAMPGQGRSTDPDLFENGTLHKVRGYTTDLLTDRAVSFIQREHERPFLLYLAHKAAHPDVVQPATISVSARAAVSVAASAVPKKALAYFFNQTCSPGCGLSRPSTSVSGSPSRSTLRLGTFLMNTPASANPSE